MEIKAKMKEEREAGRYFGHAKDGRTIYMSASFIREFLTCRRRTFFKYIEGLEPLTKAYPLSFGKAIHAGFELMMTGGDMKAIRAVIEECFDADGKTDPEIAAVSEYNIAAALAGIEAFDRFVPWRDWKVVNTETAFDISLGYGAHYIGRRDLMVEIGDMKLWMELKSAYPTPEYVHHLNLDDQAGYYIVAGRRLGMDVRGVMYVFIPRPTIRPLKATPPEKRQYKKDGTLYASQRDRDESVAEWKARCDEWYAANPSELFQRNVITRSADQIKELESRFNQIASDVKMCHAADAWYPNGAACSVLPCPYSSICIEDTAEGREAFQSKADPVKAEVEQGAVDDPF